jgi:hypothetical protein
MVRIRLRRIRQTATGGKANEDDKEDLGDSRRRRRRRSGVSSRSRKRRIKMRRVVVVAVNKEGTREIINVIRCHSNSNERNDCVVSGQDDEEDYEARRTRRRERGTRANPKDPSEMHRLAANDAHFDDGEPPPLAGDDDEEPDMKTIFGDPIDKDPVRDPLSSWLEHAIAKTNLDEWARTFAQKIKVSPTDTKELDKTLNAISELSNQLSKDDASRRPQAAADTSTEKDDPTVASFKEASDMNNNASLRGTPFGNAWYNALKKDKGMKTNYAAMTAHEKKVYRAEWALGNYQTMSKSKTFSQSFQEVPPSAPPNTTKATRSSRNSSSNQRAAASAIRFDTVRHHTIRYGSARYDGSRYDSIRLDTIRVDSIAITFRLTSSRAST